MITGDTADGNAASNGAAAPAVAPTAAAAAPRRALVGHQGFQRSNPMTDLFTVHKFHHVEFWCGDATNTSRRCGRLLPCPPPPVTPVPLRPLDALQHARNQPNKPKLSPCRFGYGLGMTLAAKSDQGTGNHHFASYALRSNDLLFAFTAPYGAAADKAASRPPLPWYDPDRAFDFFKRHGLAVRALGILVEDAAAAFAASTAAGARPVQPPTRLADAAGGGALTVAEVELYGDVVLRLVSGDFSGPYLPGYERVVGAPAACYGLRRLDHAVGNVPELLKAVDYLAAATGFHEFAEFVAEDVGTVDSGLNSVVLASNNEMVLLPVNEPTFGTRRKSQIQTYLEQNAGAGLQHLALKTDDIFETLRQMRARSGTGGFEFMPRPADGYYAALPAKIGPVLTGQQYREVAALGILVDRDDQGVLLQIFTKPLGDRPTVFIEIIQRLCTEGGAPAAAAAAAAAPAAEPAAAATRADATRDVGGCGGFGKGNFTELFKSIENYETDLGINGA